ncbi:MAG: HAD-IIIA family hydrolase [Epsilonproteobacteria bacterium]|nr:HAD-IIIA family hydrolase [Campylobacterota bacterium]
MIELIVLDVDGTMTDGKIYYSNELEEFKAFNVKDGLMIKSWNMMGKKTAIITGKSSKIVQKRAQELDIQIVRQGIKDKKQELDGILEELGFGYNQVAFIGDDMNDYTLLQRVSLSFCPFDANERIQDIVKYRLHKKGGEGCVAEMIEMIIKRDKLEGQFLQLWI